MLFPGVCRFFGYDAANIAKQKKFIYPLKT